MATRIRSMVGCVWIGALTVTAGCFDPSDPAADETGDTGTGTSGASTTGISFATSTGATSTSGSSTGADDDTTGTPDDEDENDENTTTSAGPDAEASSSGAIAEGSSSDAETTSSGAESSGETAGPDCSCGPYEVCFPSGCTPAHVVYLNFDAEGEMIYAPGEEDATQNRHGLNRNLSGELAGYGRGTKREDVLEAVREDFLGYGVVITDTRPEDVDYSMIVFTPAHVTFEDALFTAAADCNNAVPNSLAFVHLSASDASPASFHANVVTRTIAMGIGLELVTNEDDIMGASVSSTDSWFLNTCETIEGDPTCPDQHAHFCDDGTQQDAHRELELVFGWYGSA